MPAPLYTFKPAIFRSPKTYSIRLGEIGKLSKDGKVETIGIRDIRRARYVETQAREYYFRRLDLEDNYGQKMRIHLTSTRLASAKNDRDLGAFYQLMQDIGKYLQNDHPEQTINIGETGKAGWAMFGVGVFTIVGAIGLLVLALVTGVSEKKLLNAFLPMFGMAALGVFVCMSASPWKPRHALTVIQFRNLIQSRVSLVGHSEGALGD